MKDLWFEFRWARGESDNEFLIPTIWNRLVINSEKPRDFFLGFLVDTGGCSYDVNIPGFVELKNKIHDSKYDDSVVKSYCTESWCADINGDVTKISFAYDESYGENMDTELFYRVLCEWIDFVQQGPGQDGDSPIKKFTV
ncbi:hypothetical protein [Hydrogenophaga taeniospiralis]|uniref:hypothetical protein n=1 Tax=Hydrogenophaga taeniospiralis TaxID=65656 RepID=UPI0024358821|nr:hypothetical protein [Hydrogenophaga taeniospiralis]